MTQPPPDPSPAAKRPRRRRDPEATRAAILSAARLLYGRSGYDQVSLREIAAEAGADVALVKRYFGGKEGLFTEALKASFRAVRLDDWEPARFAAEIAASMAGDPHAEEAGADSFQFLLRAAVSKTTAPLAQIAMQDRFIEPISRWIGGERAETKGRVLTAFIIGLLVERLVRGQALEGAQADEFTEEVRQVFVQVMADRPGGRTL